MDTPDEKPQPAEDDFDAQLEQMMGHIEEWKEKEYHRLKAEHDRKYGHQLSLLGEVDGVHLADVRHYLIQLLILEEVLSTLNDSRNTVYQVMKEKRLPVKTVKASLKIAKARRKRDASVEVLEACIQVADTLLAQQEGHGEPSAQGYDPETGEVQ